MVRSNSRCPGSTESKPPAAGDPAGYQFVADPTQHVVYRGTDQHIHELWWDASQGWGHGDLTPVVGTPPAALRKPFFKSPRTVINWRLLRR